jgi:hypothetical protein
MNQLRIALLIAAAMTNSIVLAAEPSAATPAKTENAPAGAPAAKKEQGTQQPATAASSQAADAAGAKSADKPAPAAVAKDAAKSDADEEHAPAPSAADKAPSPQRFTPSEQVRADFDVSFPIDI